MKRLTIPVFRGGGQPQNVSKIVSKNDVDKTLRQEDDKNISAFRKESITITITYSHTNFKKAFTKSNITPGQDLIKNKRIVDFEAISLQDKRLPRHLVTKHLEYKKPVPRNDVGLSLSSLTLVKNINKMGNIFVIGGLI